MSESISTTTYYIRVRGRILGPYDLGQLKVLRSRGQFSRAHEVSTDRQVWQSAAVIELLLNGNSRTISADAGESAEVSIRQPEISNSVRSMTAAWYYALDEEKLGPVTLLELRGMLASQQLMPSDLVWKEGLPEWCAASQVAELRTVLSSNPQAADSRAGVPALHYCFACGSPTDARAEVCPKCGVRQPTPAAKLERNKFSAAFLALFLGSLGVHRFYLGDTTIGLLYLMNTLLPIPLWLSAGLIFSASASTSYLGTAAIFTTGMIVAICWAVIPALFAFIEFIIFLCMSDASFSAKYNRR